MHQIWTACKTKHCRHWIWGPVVYMKLECWWAAAARMSVTATENTSTLGCKWVAKIKSYGQLETLQNRRTLEVSVRRPKYVPSFLLFRKHRRQKQQTQEPTILKVSGSGCTGPTMQEATLMANLKGSINTFKRLTHQSPGSLRTGQTSIEK